MSKDIENRRKLAKDIVSALVTDRPELEQFTDQRSLELVHLPKLERLYQTEYYPAYRDALSPEDFRRGILKDFNKWENEIAESFQAYTQAIKAPGKPISLSPNTEDKDNDPRHRYLYTLFTNTLTIRFLQLSFPIMLESEAAQMIREAEDKAAQRFKEWQNQARYILEEADPAILKKERRKAIEAYRQSFTPELHHEVNTRLTLFARLKFILGEVKAGRDKRPATHYTNRLARRMANAQIIEYLAGLIEGQEGRKAEPEEKTPDKGTPENPTQWQLAAYYRYLKETDYPTPFDDYRTQKPAFEEIAKRHSKYGYRSAGGFKQQWNLSNGAQRPHTGNLPDLRVVLEMLTEYPRAAEKCKKEIKETE